MGYKESNKNSSVLELPFLYCSALYKDKKVKNWKEGKIIYYGESRKAVLCDHNGKRLDSTFIKARDVERIEKDYEFEFEKYVCFRDSLYEDDNISLGTREISSKKKAEKIKKFKSPVNISNSFKLASEFKATSNELNDNNLINRLFQKREVSLNSNQNNSSSKWSEFVSSEMDEKEEREEEIMKSQGTNKKNDNKQIKFINDELNDSNIKSSQLIETRILDTKDILDLLEDS